jgi:hypothetical protein
MLKVECWKVVHNSLQYVANSGVWNQDNPEFFKFFVAADGLLFSNLVDTFYDSKGDSTAVDDFATVELLLRSC